MKNANLLAVTLLVLGASGCSQAPNPAEVKAAQDKAAADAKAQDLADIKALEDKFMTAFKAKDIDAIMQAYVPDDSLLVFDATPPREYKGAQAYRKDWEGFLAMFPGPLEADISDLDVTVGGGDVAYGSSIQHGIGTAKNGKKTEFTVRVTDGYKKVNGKWLIAHEHVSFPVDIATGKADLLSKP
jgi:ketosteroid isomerase-like protein